MTIPTGEVADLLAALIRNRCVNDATPSSGQEHRSIATLAQYLGADGAQFEPAPRRRSAVYRVPGSSPGAPALMLMGHVDVVPVTSDVWSVDPFAAERRDGFIWGRGAVDMLRGCANRLTPGSRFGLRQAEP